MTAIYMKPGNDFDFNPNKRQNGNNKNNGYRDECAKEFSKHIKDYKKDLPELVKKYRDRKINLKFPAGYAVRITDLDGTVYWGRDEMLESWNELYLPEPTEMVVIGAVDNFPSLADGLQLIVMVDSQGRVYFYENEVLHRVAVSLKDLIEKGARFSPTESYEYGQYTAPESEEEHLKLLEEMGLSRIDESTKNFVHNKDKDLTDLVDFLESF